jgi:hypothetical protein
MQVKLHRWALIAVFVLAASSFSSGQEIRLANGIVIKGEVVGSGKDGLEVKTPLRTQTYSWETLSPATRYRYQPEFRANYDVILRGLPPHMRTNAPDPQVVLELPKASATQKPETPTQETAAPEEDTALLFDQFEYQHVTPIHSTAFPDAELRSAPHASYIGFQYGPGRDEVLYLAFDTKGPSELSDVLFAYSPAAGEFNTTQRITGFKRGSGAARYVNYRKLKVSTSFGNITANMEFDSETSGLATNEMGMTVSVELLRDKTRSRFTLNQRFTDLLHGPGLIPVKGVLDMPMLWLALDTAEGAPKLAGNLNMSNMKMAPRDGMDSRVAISVTDEDGNAVQRESVRLDAASFSAQYGIISELKRTQPGTTYKIKASIDLGPFIGPVEFEDEITTPRR